MSAQSYINEIKSIDVELKRLRALVRDNNKKKAIAQQHLYEYMVRKGEQHIGNISIDSIRPKTKALRKKPSDKKRDAINLFYKIGVPDPTSFWNELQSTQKATPTTHSE